MSRPISDEKGNIYGTFMALKRVQSTHKTPRYLCRCMVCGAEKELFINSLKPEVKTTCKSCWAGASSRMVAYLYISPSIAEEAQGSNEIAAVITSPNVKHYMETNARTLQITREAGKTTYTHTYTDWNEVGNLVRYRECLASTRDNELPPTSEFTRPPGLSLLVRTEDFKFLTDNTALAKPFYIETFLMANKGRLYSKPKKLPADHTGDTWFALWPEFSAIDDLPASKY